MQDSFSRKKPAAAASSVVPTASPPRPLRKQHVLFPENGVFDWLVIYLSDSDEEYDTPPPSISASAASSASYRPLRERFFVTDGRETSDIPSPDHCAFSNAEKAFFLGYLPSSRRAMPEADQLYLEGVSNQFGYKIPINSAKAVACFKKAAEMGHVRAKHYLAINIKISRYLLKDLPTSQKLYSELYFKYLPNIKKEAKRRGATIAKCQLALLELNQTDPDNIEGAYRRFALIVIPLLEAEMKKGVMMASCILASFYYQGRFVPRNVGRAVELYKSVADQGFAMAQNNLGACYERGIGIDKDEYEAVRLYELAANQGLAIAQYNLGRCREKGIGGDSNEEEAKHLFLLAADQGFAEAHYVLGRWLRSIDTAYMGEKEEKKEEDIPGFSDAASKAKNHFSVAAKQGYVPAQLVLALLYGNHKYHKKLVEAASEPLKEDPKVKNCLAYAYHELGMAAEFKGDIVQADVYYLKAAEQWSEDYAPQSARARCVLGKAYLKINRPEEDKKAFFWFQKAADGQRLALAQNNLGWMYQHNRGIDPSLKDIERSERAIECYKAAAEQGLAEAQCNLGSMYENYERYRDIDGGMGRTERYRRAEVWYEKSANQGSLKARYRLGRLYRQKYSVLNLSRADGLGKAAYHWRIAATKYEAAKQALADFKEAKYENTPEAYYHRHMFLHQSLEDLFYTLVPITDAKERANLIYLKLFLNDPVLSLSKKRELLKSFSMQHALVRLFPQNASPDDSRTEHQLYEILLEMGEISDDLLLKEKLGRDDRIPPYVRQSLHKARKSQLYDAIKEARGHLSSLRAEHHGNQALVDVLDSLDHFFVCVQQLSPDPTVSKHEQFEGLIEHYQLILGTQKVLELPEPLQKRLRDIADFLQAKHGTYLPNEQFFAENHYEIFRDAFTRKLLSFWLAGGGLYSEHLPYRDATRQNTKLALEACRAVIKIIPFGEKLVHFYELAEISMQVYERLRGTLDVFDGIEGIALLGYGLSILRGKIVDMPSKLKRLYKNLGPNAPEIISLMALTLCDRYAEQIEKLTNANEVIIFAEDAAKFVSEYLMLAKSFTEDQRTRLDRDASMWCRHAYEQGRSLKSIGLTAEVTHEAVRSGDLLSRAPLKAVRRLMPQEEDPAADSKDDEVKAAQATPEKEKTLNLGVPVFKTKEGALSQPLTPLDEARFGGVKATPDEIDMLKMQLSLSPPPPMPEEKKAEEVQAHASSSAVKQDEAALPENVKGQHFIFTHDALERCRDLHPEALVSTLKLMQPVRVRVDKLEVANMGLQKQMEELQAENAGVKQWIKIFERKLLAFPEEGANVDGADVLDPQLRLLMLGSLVTEIERLKKADADQQKQIADLAARLATEEARPSAPDPRVERLVEADTQRKEQIEALDQRVTKVEANVEALSPRVDALPIADAEQQGQIGGLKIRVDEVEATVSALSPRVNTLELAVTGPHVQ
ncbi:MAG: hypothetical protein K0Q74_888, partial [Gammaproteobacteria bacterium]|nr:hypothetical protein [Gammaproteobacteria bacterium]